MFYRCYFSFPSVIYLKDTYYNSQEVKLRFMNAMHSVAKVAGAAVAKAFDLSGYKTACDLGGEGTMHIRLLLCSLIFKPFLNIYPYCFLPRMHWCHGLRVC